MNAKIGFIGLLVLFSFSVMIVSCGNDDLAGTGEKSDKSVSTTETTGGIMDLGAVEGNVHGMQVSLSYVSISINDVPNGNAAVTNRLNIYLYSESDGIIKDGTYHFSGTKNVSSFIFKTALVYMQNKETGRSDAFEVSGGTIVVARSGTYYTFNMKGTLSNGNAILASFAGSLSYSD